MSSQVKIAERKSSRRFWPVMGFLLIVALTIVAYAVAPVVIRWLKQTFRQFSTVGLTDQQLRLYFTVIVAALLSLLVALIIAISAPKRAINVNLASLGREREAMVEDQRRRKKQQRRVNRKFREHVEGKDR